MREKLISFDTAKLASEKCFDWKVENYFDETENNKEVNLLADTIIRDYNYFVTTLKGEFAYEYIEKGYLQELYNIVTEDYCGYLKRPTQSLLQKWLREVHKIDIQITIVKAGYKEYKVEIYKQPENTNQYTYFFIKEEDGLYIKYFQNYEDALEEGLLIALKQLP